MRWATPTTKGYQVAAAHRVRLPGMDAVQTRGCPRRDKYWSACWGSTDPVIGAAGREAQIA